MDERSMQLRVGVVVISALLLTAILILLIGDFPTPFQQTKTYRINFKDAPGVIEGTPVRKSGILIGRVTDVQFRDDAPGVRITVKIRTGDGAEVYDNETFQIKGSLLGDALLEVVPINEQDPLARQVPLESVDATALAPGEMFVMQVDPPAPPRPLPDGAVVEGRVLGNPLDLANELEGDIKATLKSFQEAGDQVGRLAENVNSLLEQDGREPGELLKKMELAADNFNLAMENINQLVGDENLQNDLRSTVEQMPQLMRQMSEALSTVQGDIQTVLQRADKNLQNLEGFTGPLKQKGPIIAERIDASLADLTVVMNQLAAFTEKLNSSEGTLGGLLNDPDLYQQLSSAAININQVTTELRPIVNDIRTISDKIARDPGQLGVRGALRPNPRTKNTDFDNNPPPPTDWRQPLNEWPRHEVEWEVVPR
ncbi:MAG: MlaD family protein [Pirellulales bacterium]